MSPAELDPRGLRKPRANGPTRFLYLANCGSARGDTRELLCERLSELAGESPEALFLGPGVSLARFGSPGPARRALEALAGSRWVARFAEPEASEAGPPAPLSAEATADVEVPGLQLLPGFVSEDEARELLAAVDARPWDEAIRRRVQHYGRAFDYAQLRLADAPAEEMPGALAEIGARLCAPGLLPEPPDQLTVNEYQPGVGIALHVDAHSAFGGEIAALSLGAGVVMDFQRPGEAGKLANGRHHRLAPPPPAEARKGVWLPANSLLILRGEARYAWQHGIAWRKTDCVAEGQQLQRGRRVSLTFRRAGRGSCRCAWPALCDSQNPAARAQPTRLAGQAAEAGAPEAKATEVGAPEAGAPEAKA